MSPFRVGVTLRLFGLSRISDNRLSLLITFRLIHFHYCSKTTSMRGVILLCAILCTHAYAIASVNDTTLTEKSVREKILNDIQQNLDRKNKAIDSTITRLDGRIGKLDSVIKQTGNPKDRIDKLVERVQILEEKQKALEENELNTYQANYQSAIINLVSMEREIKPLVLFHTTRDFFNTLPRPATPLPTMALMQATPGSRCI